MDKKHSESEEQVPKNDRGGWNLSKTTKCCRDSGRLGLGKVMRAEARWQRAKEEWIVKKWCDNVNHCF